MNALEFRVTQLLKSLPLEHRRPVADAALLSDGTVLGFQQELIAQTWEYPMLDVQDLIDQVAYDVA